jgi:DNA-directed RNA polymerase specialized sigma24 family protein
VPAQFAVHRFMGRSPSISPWWDREFDEHGKPIRTDVREAAQRVWQQVQAEVEKILGDSTDAPELFENAVRAVSTYLGRQNAEPHDPSGLLIVAVHRLGRRLARHRGRVQAIGASSELSERLRAPDWTAQADRSIFLKELTNHLSPENQGILRLRMDDFEWDEIARMRRVSPRTLRSNFWRDVRRAHLKLLGKPTPKAGNDKM